MQIKLLMVQADQTLNKKGIFLMHYIYSLCHPVTQEIRYIGQTKNPKRRYRQHTQKCNYSKAHVAKWIRSLKKQNILPMMKVLQLCDTPTEVDAAEIFWIDTMRLVGKYLCNHTDGGGGHRGLFSDEHCKNISVAHRTSRENRTSPYFGVSPHLNRYRAYVCKDKKRIHLGVFGTAEEAARVVDSATVYYEGVAAIRNFPNELPIPYTPKELPHQKRRNTSSQYVGVSFDHTRNAYAAAIRVLGKQKHLGRFADEVEAAKAYDDAYYVHKGKRVNFPGEETSQRTSTIE